jgi:diguanylate cyclase (GGDEF)-like protein
MIESYQNQKNYNTLFIDEEKKLLNSTLLDQTRLMLMDRSVVYLNDGTLLSYLAKQENNLYALYFTAFRKGALTCLSKLSSERDYKAKTCDSVKEMLHQHERDHIDAQYKLYDGHELWLELHGVVESAPNKVAHIDMHKNICKGLENMAHGLGVEIEITSEYKGISKLYGNEASEVYVSEEPTRYSSALQLKGGVYVVVSQKRAQVLTYLFEEHLLEFLLIVLMVMVAMVYALRSIYEHLLIRPLSQLMRQILKVKHQDYSECRLINTADELEDISASINELSKMVYERERRLNYLANHDTLTKIYNRRYFSLELDKINFSSEEKALLFLDLDNFKVVNDTLGHSAGDSLLIDIASKISRILDKENTIFARVGGDEFAILTPYDEGGIERLIEKIFAIFTHTMTLEDSKVNITCSIGIAIYPKDSIYPKEILRYADMALYTIKDSGKNGYIYYSDTMMDEVAQKNHILDALKESLEYSKGDFRMVYQPKISAKTQKPTALEALVRWNHNSYGLIFPNVFISLAEESGYIIDIGRIIIHKSLEDFKRLLDGGYKLQNISINLSPIQIEKDEALIDFIDRTIKEFGLNPQMVEFELTENVLALKSKDTIKTLTRLTDLGVSLSIDDFGTGYSSISYVKDFPMSKLKIDKSFIDNLNAKASDKKLIKIIIELAKTFGLSVTAEGVEDKRQASVLIGLGCDELQGFYYSKPLNFGELMLYFDDQQIKE